jgi:hypothetical protein
LRFGHSCPILKTVRGNELVRRIRRVGRELKTGTLHGMLKQLGLTLKDIEG